MIKQITINLFSNDNIDDHELVCMCDSIIEECDRLGLNEMFATILYKDNDVQQIRFFRKDGKMQWELYRLKEKQ